MVNLKLGRVAHAEVAHVRVILADDLDGGAASSRDLLSMTAPSGALLLETLVVDWCDGVTMPPDSPAPK